MAAAAADPAQQLVEDRRRRTTRRWRPRSGWRGTSPSWLWASSSCSWAGHGETRVTIDVDRRRLFLRPLRRLGEGCCCCLGRRRVRRRAAVCFQPQVERVPVYCTVVRTEYNVFRMCTYVFTSFCTRENSSVLASWRRAPWARFLRRPGGRGTAQPPQDPWAPKAAPARGRTRSRPACPVYTSALPDTGRHSSSVRSVLSSLHARARAHTHAFLIGSRAFVLLCPSPIQSSGVRARLGRTPSRGNVIRRRPRLAWQIASRGRRDAHAWRRNLPGSNSDGRLGSWLAGSTRSYRTVPVSKRRKGKEIGVASPVSSEARTTVCGTCTGRNRLERKGSPPPPA